MNYDWFNIFNKTEFEDSGLTSREYTVVLDSYGEKTIIATKGVGVGVLFDDVFLPLEFDDQNPWAFEDRAVYVDENDDVWVGVAVED